MKPRRILIRGRAGVGKTTLCKKIVCEFTRGTWSQWSQLFDRVIWVPLRNLKLEERHRAGYNFFHLFNHEYFSLPNDRPDLSRALSDTMEKTRSSRTLFLLDGLDEVSQDLSDGGDMFRFLKELLDQPNAIITSRPSGKLPAGLHAIDIELETIGFYPDQVNEYLERNSSEQASEVQSFLQGHLLIRDLIRIPIQLDALCFTWSESINSKMKLDTMTVIYRAIEHSLWKKDILRLEKKIDGKPVTNSMIQHSDPDEIRDLVNDEICFLEGLAFTGLHNDVIDFESRHRSVISTHFKPPAKTFLLDKTLPHLSFLRTSDLLSKRGNRSYHFLHLTYQEYFAARYFVRQWKAKQPLDCLQLRKGERSNIGPVIFLQEHKYDPRYDIFWRFVTGLLDADGEALSFFQAIEEEPRDLLGPTHQRLVMHCLSEIEQKESTFTELRAKLETQLEQWLLFECDFTGRSRLASEMECPEQVLVNALKQASEGARMSLLRSLSIRTTVPSSIINVISPWLKDGASKHLPTKILNILRHQHISLPDTILQDITARLEDQEAYVRRAAIEALQGQANLSKEVLQGITARLKDQHWVVRLAAIEALQGQASLSKEVLQGITARLGDQDGGVRRAAIKALQGQANLSKEVLQDITARLGDQDGGVRQAAIKALQDQANFSKEVLQDIIARLEDQDGGVRQAAIKALQDQANLKEVLQGIIARLEDQEAYVRQAAIEALQGQANLSKEVLQGIIARLKDQEAYVRQAAIKALQDQANFSKEVLQGIIARLKDQEAYVRQAAIEALQGQANLKEVLQGITARLEDQEAYVRQAAIEALQGQANLKEVLQGITARLEDQEAYVRQAAIEALQGQANLKEVLQGIIARLEDQEAYVRQAAIEALQGQANLSKEVLQGITARLEDQEWYVRQAAIEALQGQASLSKEVLQGITARLGDQDGGVRRAAIKALQGQANLSKEVLQDITAQLEDQEGDIRQAAIEVLINQTALSLDALSLYIKPLYKALLQKSFKEHIYWYPSDSSFIRMGFKHISLSSRQHNGKEAVVKLLVEKGAANIVKDGDRRPRLHWAAEN
ncbi:armadillo-type protein [Immersiella caudata]|uniref:Armadillo-type protein n=1 Tax=Immersiella caudata TaxID=314043 RepID=A0AA40BXP7_9PEZI|nr:armadillo-type protein [Immersiella caudata]